MDILGRSRRHLKAAVHLAPVERDSSIDMRAIDREVRRAVDLAALQKRLTQEEIFSLQNEAKSSAIRAASEAAAAQASRTASTTARTATTTTHSTYSFFNKFGSSSAATSTAAAATPSAVRSSAAASSAVTSTTTTSSTVASSAARSSAAASSVVRSSAAVSSAPAVQSTSTSTTTTPAVQTITRSPNTSSASVSHPSASASVAAAASNSSSTGMSNGAIAGAVVGVLAGIVLLAAVIGWIYRKYSARSYNTKAPWAKIDDDDITPFPPNEKYHHDDDDIYGPSSAPVIGSRRALALARQNNFNEDGSMRPQSEFATANHAGFGAGSYGGYPQLPAQYAFDPQGRPYHPDAGRAPMPHVYEDGPAVSPHAYSTPDSSRQLVGNRGFPEPVLAPHSLGRPQPPHSNAQLSQLEDYDLSGPGYDAPEPPYTPNTASTTGAWVGDIKQPINQRLPPMGPDASSQVEVLRPLPPTPPKADIMMPAAAPQGLPSFEPMSPFMTAFDMSRSNNQHEHERATQKRMYTEVADAAGVREPPTPNSAGNLNDSTSTAETSSSFSAHDPMPNQVPSFQLNPPQPYVHGQPLSPLTELPTPLSTSTSRSAPEPSHEVNPYERTLLAAKQPLAPPYSAASTTGATGMPSPQFPPPSPGGMSVPGSITDSPQQWDNRELHGSRQRVHSVVDSDDAYGGI